MMTQSIRASLVVAALALHWMPTAWAADDDAKRAAQDASYTAAFKKFSETPLIAAMRAEAYGYALFPTIGKGGFFLGGAFGNGRVYVGGRHVGNASMGQVTVGFQLGGTAFSEIVLFKSDLQPSGAVYTRVESVSLGERAATTDQ